MIRSSMPQKRHRSREMALLLLYSLDMRKNQSPEEALELFGAEDDREVQEFARVLTCGAWKCRGEIDDLLREHITGWRPERMLAVDRAAIRLALFEGVTARMTPVPVVISEAVELAKVFGAEDSGKFVNGVLGRIVRSISIDEPGKKPKEGEPPHGGAEAVSTDG